MKNIKYFLILIVSLIVLGSSGCPTKIKGTSPGKIPTKTLTVLPDKTGSSAPDELPRFADALKEALVQSENFSQTEVVNLGGNGKTTWISSTKRFDFPPQPVYFFDEDDARAKAKKEGCGRRVPCIERYLRERRKETEEKYNSDLGVYKENLNLAAQRVSEEILQNPTKEPACSDIQEMAERVAQSSEYVIWVTDADHNCKTPFGGVEFKNKVLIGLVPLKSEIPGNFGKRLAEIGAKFPNAQVKPLALFNKEMLAEFLKTR